MSHIYCTEERNSVGEVVGYTYTWSWPGANAAAFRLSPSGRIMRMLFSDTIEKDHEEAVAQDAACNARLERSR